MRPTRLQNRFAIALLATMCIGPLTGCPEDDPEGNNTTNNTTGTNNSTGGTNNPTGGTNNTTQTCASECAAIVADAALTTACGGAAPDGFAAACETECGSAQDAVFGAASIGGAAGAEVIIQRLGETAACPTSGTACMPLTTDYTVESNEAWDACVSDGGAYVNIEPTISSAGRVAAYEQIADLLWRKATPPSSEDFLSAREIYATDEGLDSRVQRREDEHYPPVTDGDGNTLRCRDEGVPAMDPDRCVGPAKILPLLNDAFTKGAMGEEPIVQAARVDAALLWFFHVSTHKEATTCTVAKKDCDSSYAYYTGDKPRDGGIGLAGVVRDVAPDAHDSIWDGILAVRCWRDLDGADEATDLVMRDTAITQMDESLHHGTARVVADRVARMTQHTGELKKADWTFIQILGGILNRDATTRDAAKASTLAAELAKGVDAADPAAVLNALNGLYPCP